MENKREIKVKVKCSFILLWGKIPYCREVTINQLIRINSLMY